MKYFIFLLISISALSIAAQDPFYHPKDRSEKTTTFPLNCVPNATIAADIPMNQLKIKGVINYSNRSQILLANEQQIYLAGNDDIIAQEGLRIKSIQKNSVELENWQHAKNCTLPQIQTIKF